MFRSVNVEDYMLQNPARVKAGDNIMQAIEVIVAQRISGVCVVDDDNNLVGVLSELDCLRAILSATYNKCAIGTVAEYMTHDRLVTTVREVDIVNVAQEMLDQKKRRLPVVVDGKLVGQITCRQLLKAVKDFGATG